MMCNALLQIAQKVNPERHMDIRPYRNETYSQFFHVACPLGRCPMQHREEHPNQVDAANIPRPGSPIISIFCFGSKGRVRAFRVCGVRELFGHLS